MTEKTDKILNQIKKELEGIKKELKISNASRDKRYKEWTKMKKKWKKTHKAHWIEYTAPTYSLSITINLLSTNDFKTKLQSHIPSVTYSAALQEEWE